MKSVIYWYLNSYIIHLRYPDLTMQKVLSDHCHQVKRTLCTVFIKTDLNPRFWKIFKKE